MKKQLLFITVFLGLIATGFAQSEKCKSTCTIDKIIHEDAFLGVQFGNECHKEKRSDKGVVILKVIENTTAEDNNLKAFDLVTKINDTKVSKSVEAIKLIKSFNPFDVVSLTINREGKTITKKVVLGAKTTKVIQEEVCCDELSSLTANNIKIFPNPAVEELNITFNSINRGDYKFAIYMANGVLVKEYTKKLGKDFLKQTIPVDKLEDGVYVLKITNKETTFSKLFVVSRK